MSSLQRVQLCHRNISLESIVLLRQSGVASDGTADGFSCTISQLGNALRIPFDDDGTAYHLLQPQPILGGSSPQYIAPELWNGDGDDSCPFDGFAVDLWAAAVILLAMLLGNDAFFVAPVIEDRLFQQICVLGRLNEYVVACQGKRGSRTPSVSRNALDLLQSMLHIDPKDRPTLSQVQQHLWFLQT